jgi:hypothetical protein
VAGWLLYSVFRSRDVRNNRNRRKGEAGSSAGVEAGLYPFKLAMDGTLLTLVVCR